MGDDTARMRSGPAIGGPCDGNTLTVSAQYRRILFENGVSYVWNRLYRIWQPEILA